MSQIAATSTLAAFVTDPARSRTLPGFYYYDADVFRRETTAIFQHTWQYVGHVAMLPEPGSYIVRDILDQSVVVLRDADGALRAFFNVCQHRAHRLLEGEGRVGAVVTCPYHAWAYGLDGTLRTVRGSERMTTTIDREAFCLASVRLDQFLGFLFVNLDGKAPPFAEVTGALAAEIAAFSPHAATLKCAHRNEFPLAANWKNSVENYDECFHCPIQHQSLLANALDYASYRVVTHEHHHSHSSRAPANRGYATVTEGAAKPDAFASWLLFPNWCIEAYPGGNLTVFHHVPLGPERTVQRCEWYFPHATPRALEREVIDFVDVVRAEDIPICESVQNGLHSLGYRRGAFVVDAARSEISEHAVHDFQLKVLRALGEIA